MNLKLRLHRDERGFVLLELVVGLPLIVMLLWSMNSMFVNSWHKCKYMIADFVLQQEMESAMARIVETAKLAYGFEYKNEIGFGDVSFYFYDITKDSSDKYQIFSAKDKPSETIYRYFVKDYKMYRGRTSGVSNPITGESWKADTAITKFICQPMSSNSKLLYIRLEGMSYVSKHTLVLTTEVYMRGLKNE